MVLIPILLTYMAYQKIWFQVVTYFITYISGLLRAIKYFKVHHFADDASLNFSSSIKLINKQVNDNFTLNNLAYIANGWNGNQNLVTVRSSSFENECVNYIQYKQRKLKMLLCRHIL